MMNAITLIAAISLGQTPGQTARPLVNNAVSTMLVKYANASTVVADILFTQSSNGKSLKIESYLQYSRDQKLYLKQTYQQNQVIVVSDGKFLSYSIPRDFTTSAGKMIVEQQGKLNIVDVYTAGSQSLFDASPMLDVLVSRSKYLKFLTKQWSALRWEDSNSDELIAVGDWRMKEDLAPSGTFRLEMSPSGDPIRYTVIERIVIPNNRIDLEVISDWQVNAKFNTPIEEALFNTSNPR